MYSREHKSLAVDFLPAKNYVDSPDEPWWRGVIEQHFLQYAILFDALMNKGEFRDYILNVLINCNRQTFLLASQPRKPKQGCHHGFARDENTLSTTSALNWRVAGIDG